VPRKEPKNDLGSDKEVRFGRVMEGRSIFEEVK
jgi:hypothetical protein